MNGCMTTAKQQSSPQSSSSPTSIVSPSSIHSSPQASSQASFGQDRSPVSSPTRCTTFSSASIQPLIKPSAIKEQSSPNHTPLSVHGVFPNTSMSSMCFPLQAIYASQNPYSSMMGNNFNALFSPHAIARQMSFLGNSFSQSMSGKRGIPGEEFARFQPAAFSPVSSSHSLAAAHRSPNVAANFHANAKHQQQACLPFPFNTTHAGSTGAHHLHQGQSHAGMINSFPAECPVSCSPPPFKRRMLGIPSEPNIAHAVTSESSSQGSTIPSHNWCRRSPSQPLICPLCTVSLDGIDINNHFYEEVHKVETLRKLNDWAVFNSKECNDTNSIEHQFESRSNSSLDKKLPYSRWETFQRVKQNRHSRLTALLRQTKRKFEMDELRNETMMMRQSQMMWNHCRSSNEATADLQKQENDPEDNDDSSSEKNVDVVSDVDINMSEAYDKRSECDERNNGDDEDDESERDRERESKIYHRVGVEASNVNEKGNVGSSGTLTDGKERKPLENGLASESETPVNSDNHSHSQPNVKETIEILRKRIRELENKENDNNNNDSICHACKNVLDKPVVSAICWHVFCESCWQQVVDSNKHSCPKCEAIVTTRDLRRVFM